jgi:hypothetical protein
MKEKLKQLREWVSLWPDTILLLVGVSIFILSAPIFSWLSGMIGGPESGLLNNFIIVAMEISLINALVFLGIKLNFPITFDWYKKKHALPKEWLQITPWQRFIIFSILYVALFFAGVFLMASLQ